MNQSIIIHFQHVFMRAKFNDILKANKENIRIISLTNTYCELKFTPFSTFFFRQIVKQLPLSRVLSKTISKGTAKYRKLSWLDNTTMKDL